MQPRITGWEQTSTDPVLARRFVRALFEGHADAAAELVAADCVVHRPGGDDETGGDVTALDQVLEEFAAADLELESVESTVSDGLVVTSVTVCVDGEAVGVAGDDTASSEGERERERPPFASVRVEDDRVEEVWLHVEASDLQATRSRGGFVSRVSAWLHAD